MEPAVARAAVGLSQLRARAGAKFKAPEQVLLTPKGLEQATDGRVAEWRAGRIAEAARVGAGPARILDATCGLGAEALALAAAGLRVLASDRDPNLAAIAAWNLGAAGHALAADALAPPFGPVEGPEESRGVLLDPDRRPGDGAQDRGREGGGRRRLDPTAFEPPAGSWARAFTAARAAFVKLPPALDPARLPGPEVLGLAPRRLAWVEAGGELRELGLWLGDWALGWTGTPSGPDPGPDAAPHAAVRLHGTPFLAGGRPADVLTGAPEVRAPQPLEAEPSHLLEVRPSARRARLAHAAAQTAHPEARPLDPSASYWAACAEPAPTPWVDTFRVLDSAPLDRRRVRKLLATHAVGRLTLKKRGLEPSSDALLAKLGHKPVRGAPAALAIAAPTPAGHRFYLVERLELSPS